jgi:hypothetical protein
VLSLSVGHVCLNIVLSQTQQASSDFEGALNRLNAMIRGIGDPLISIYARAYVCRVGLSSLIAYSYLLTSRLE